MSLVLIYVVGFAILTVGVAVAAYLLNAPVTSVVIGLLVLFGLGTAIVLSRRRQRDPPAS